MLSNLSWMQKMHCHSRFVAFKGSMQVTNPFDIEHHLLITFMSTSTTHPAISHPKIMILPIHQNSIYGGDWHAVESTDLGKASCNLMLNWFFTQYTDSDYLCVFRKLSSFLYQNKTLHSVFCSFCFLLEVLLSPK
mmetsp:Transcript_28452/g.42060  ORF Transcript_28452/g.42060 Transcript_28452/m.42060 type:complete len:135 (-) Transcript_28452:120-524(-)